MAGSVIRCTRTGSGAAREPPTRPGSSPRACGHRALSRKQQPYSPCKRAVDLRSLLRVSRQRCKAQPPHIEGSPRGFVIVQLAVAVAASMTKRYQHVTAVLRNDIASRLNGFLWAQMRRKLRRTGEAWRCRRRSAGPDLEPGVGLEPTTYRLQGGCSTN